MRRSPAGASKLAPPLPLDLHVLSLSLAFILSQDQTLRCWYIFFKISFCWCLPRRQDGILIFIKDVNLSDSVIDEACRACALRLLYYFISLVYCNRFSVLGFRLRAAAAAVPFFCRKGSAKLRKVSETAKFSAKFFSRRSRSRRRGCAGGLRGKLPSRKRVQSYAFAAFPPNFPGGNVHDGCVKFRFMRGFQCVTTHAACGAHGRQNDGAGLPGLLVTWGWESAAGS